MNGFDKKTDKDIQPLSWLGISSAALVHRLASQLSFISISINLIKRFINDKDKVLSILDKIIITQKRQKELIRDISNISKLSSGSGVGPVEVNSIINNVWSDHYKSIEDDKNAPKYHFDLLDELPDCKADEVLIKEVIQILLDNAVRSVKRKKQGHINIRTYNINEKIAIDISDNGNKISHNITGDLFIKPVPVHEGEGLGLGLLIASSLVRSWDGTIKLIRNTNNGKTFQILLNSWKTPIKVSRARRIIIVEDDKVLSKILRNSFNSHEYAVIDIAHTIEGSMKYIDSYEYDIAILDLILSKSHTNDVTGLNIARYLRERNPEMLIIMISGYLSTSIVIDALRSGVDEILSKAELSPSNINLIINKAAFRRETEKESIRQSQLNKFIYEALSMISHELRAPLLTVERNAEALIIGALGPLNPEQTEAVETIHTAVQREFLLINAHLDLTRIEEGTEKLNYQKYDLINLIREEINAHKNEARSKGVSIHTKLPIKEAIVRIDINRFRVALNPIMDNAIKFSPTGANIVIEVLLTLDYVEVRISDQGPGMRPEEINNLMNLQTYGLVKFTQRMRSSGLGLSMAKRMIELHNGKLWIESDRNSGTTVGIRIPFMR